MVPLAYHLKWPHNAAILDFQYNFTILFQRNISRYTFSFYTIYTLHVRFLICLAGKQHQHILQDQKQVSVIIITYKDTLNVSALLVRRTGLDKATLPPYVQPMYMYYM